MILHIVCVPIFDCSLICGKETREHYVVILLIVFVVCKSLSSNKVHMIISLCLYHESFCFIWILSSLKVYTTLSFDYLCISSPKSSFEIKVFQSQSVSVPGGGIWDWWTKFLILWDVSCVQVVLARSSFRRFTLWQIGLASTHSCMC